MRHGSSMLTTRSRPARATSSTALRVAGAAACLALALAYAACAAPVILEDTPTACRNGADDDGDGRTDCNDAQCIESGACEATADTCLDGIDQEGNGRVDCEEAACVAGGFCLSFPAECSLVPPSGCPGGMGCYLVTQVDRECRIAGEKLGGQECTAPTGVMDPYPCAGGHDCGGVCTLYCEDDLDCPRDSFCVSSGGQLEYNLCSIPCDLVVDPGDGGCKGDDGCYSGHQWGFSSGGYGATWFCIPFAPFAGGTAAVGDPCDDPPDEGSPLDRVCPEHLACVPDAVGDTRCRELCAITAGGVAFAPCPGGQDCVVFHPLDPRPLGPFDPSVLGACLDR